MPGPSSFGSGAVAEAAIHITFNTFTSLFYNNVLGLSGTLTGLATLPWCSTPYLIRSLAQFQIAGNLNSVDGIRLYLSAVRAFLYRPYTPPESFGELGLFLWFMVFTIGLRVSMTFYHVPHLALGAELSDDYRERSVVYAYNSILSMVGGATAYFLAWTYLGDVEGGVNEASNFLPIGVVVGSIAILLIFVSAHFTRDQIPKLTQVDDSLPPFSFRQLAAEIIDCFQNKNYLWLLLGLLCLSATNGVREAMMRTSDCSSGSWNRINFGSSV